jgi:ATP synthase protein I
MQRATARRAGTPAFAAPSRVAIKPPAVQQDWKALGTYGTLGMEIALSVVVGLFGGQWLDKKLHTGGVLTWVGFAYGLAAAGRAIYRAVRKSNQEAEEAERRDREARQKYDDDASNG